MKPQQVATIQPQAQEVAKIESFDGAMLSMIERAARDQQVDIDKMERLMQMQERAQARQAKAEYDADMAAMQPELPAIGERGKAKVNGQVRYTFALWEDINTAIKPVLSAHGFALTFRTDFSDGIAITGVLSHRAGHREQTTIKLPADASGSKNDVQAVASSVSYGKRYTAGALLNLTSHGEDDDAFTADEPGSVVDCRSAIEASTTPEELQRIAKEIKAATFAESHKKKLREVWAAKLKKVAK